MEQLVKSKQRVADHGEVFTPAHIVEAMLDLVKEESERIDSRFLEPACGEGVFLRHVLLRKLRQSKTLRKKTSSSVDTTPFSASCVYTESNYSKTTHSSAATT